MNGWRPGADGTVIASYSSDAHHREDNASGGGNCAYERSRRRRWR